MIDNIELIKPLLLFPSPDNFYFIQILQRKKDHSGIRVGGSNNNSRLITTYYINSLEKLDLQYNEMIKLANLFNARVSINLNPRSFEKTVFATLQKIANQMQNKDFYNIRKAYNSVCGIYQDELDKRWIIDIDTQDKKFVTDIEHFINLQEGNAFVTLTNPINKSQDIKQTIVDLSKPIDKIKVGGIISRTLEDANENCKFHNQCTYEES